MICAELWGLEVVGYILESGQGGKSGIAVGKRVECIYNRVMEDVGECLLISLVGRGREGSNCCMGRLLLVLVLLSLVTCLPP